MDSPTSPALADFPELAAALARFPGSAAIAPDWLPHLAPLAGVLHDLADFLASETAAGRVVLPAAEHIFRALSLPLADVRVLLVGQDPYPTPGHAIGLSFATERTVSQLPRSLQNIYRELASDLNIPPAQHGDLSAWHAQGVLLLNRVLTVAAGAAGSHQRRGWEQITDAVIAALAERKTPLVAILWGAQARSLAPVLRAGGARIIESAHPSPLSARRGFFGSRPFSQANELLETSGLTPIDWRLEPQLIELAKKV